MRPAWSSRPVGESRKVRWKPGGREFDEFVEVNMRRSPLDKRHPVAVELSFPLTVTLSLEEREQQPPGLCSAHTGQANSVVGTAERRRTILPLPKGEGRSKGNENLVWCLRNNYAFAAMDFGRRLGLRRAQSSRASDEHISKWICQERATTPLVWC